jgi:hypothetical protein
MDKKVVALILVAFLMTSVWVSAPTIITVSAKPDLPGGGNVDAPGGGDTTTTGDPISSGPTPPGE